MEASPSSKPTVRSSSPRRFASALLGLLQGHVALFAEELKEQQSNTIALLVLTGMSLLFALLLIIGGSTALLIAFWDTHRLLVICLLCAFYAIGLLVCLGILLSRLRNAPTPFSASLEELARDREQLIP
jgi:uncharacterized membrane protein YqjE